MLVIRVTGAAHDPRRRRRLREGSQVGGLAGLLVMLMIIPGLVVYEAWASHQAMKPAWTIAGPACPVVARPLRSVVGSKPPKAFAYGGVGFARHFGHASCVAWREGGMFSREIRRVCQFNAPGEVTVAVGGRTVSYQSGVAQPATVTIAHGQPSCIMGGWFRS